MPDPCCEPKVSKENREDTDLDFGDSNHQTKLPCVLLKGPDTNGGHY